MENGYLLSIIIPLKIEDMALLEGFKECFLKLSANSNNYEILIVDDSPTCMFNEVHQWFVDSNIKHIKPARNYFSGKNNKLNSIEAGIEQAKGKYILLIDDDCRPDDKFINNLINRIKNDDWDCFRCIIHFTCYGLFELMDAASVLFINIVCNHKQFWGNIGFRKDLLKALGPPNKDALFDELAIDLVFRKNAKRIGYFSDLSVEMRPINGFKSYLEHRLRYAYEDMAYPLRFSLSLAIIPVSLLLTIIKETLMPLPIFISAVVAYLITMGFLGQLIYGDKMPKYTFLFTPLWFLPYPLFSWLAIVAHATGGIYFGGNRIRRVV